MKQDALRIRITGKDGAIPARSFVTVVNSVLSILRDVDISVSKRPKPTLDWAITHLSMNSPIEITFTPYSSIEADYGQDVVTFSSRGISDLLHTATIPVHFSSHTVTTTKRMASVLSHGIAAVEIMNGYAEPVNLAAEVTKHADLIIRALDKEYELYYSFRGRIYNISDRNGREFRIEDPVFGLVVCLFNEDQLQQLKDGLFDERVEVSGRTRFRGGNRPVSIRVDRIIQLRHREELPQFADMERIGVQRSGGLLSDEENQ